MDEGDLVRKPKTPGWSQSLNKAEALPIKVAGKVIRTFKDVKRKHEEVG
jgi:hypothetical protein